MIVKSYSIKCNICGIWADTAGSTEEDSLRVARNAGFRRVRIDSYVRDLCPICARSRVLADKIKEVA